MVQRQALYQCYEPTHPFAEHTLFFSPSQKSIEHSFLHSTSVVGDVTACVVVFGAVLEVVLSTVVVAVEDVVAPRSLVTVAVVAAVVAVVVAAVGALVSMGGVVGAVHE